jgi:hypothetical protein
MGFPSPGFSVEIGGVIELPAAFLTESHLEFLHFRVAGSIPICGNAGFSGSHRSDALYQGTTLVGPLRPNKDLGF